MRASIYSCCSCLLCETRPSEIARTDYQDQPVQDEGLKRLLMSWYYAGYYTGLYEGKQTHQNQQ